MKEEVGMFDLVVKNNMLPEKIEELVPLSFIGKKAVLFYREKISLMDQLGIAEEQKAATLRDGQDAGKMLLAIETRIGELSLTEPQARATEPLPKGRGSVPSRKPLKHQRLGLSSHKAMENAQAIARHPEAVAAVIAEAEENQDIPTKTAVLTRIKLDKAEAARAAYKPGGTEEERKEIKEIVAQGEAATYLSKLHSIVIMLSASVPKDGWTEASFAEAQAMVAIIRKRLEDWK